MTTTMQAKPITQILSPLQVKVRHAIEAAQQYLWQIQFPDGHWRGELEGDTILESEYILTMYYIGRGDEGRGQLCRSSPTGMVKGSSARLEFLGEYHFHKWGAWARP